MSKVKVGVAATAVLALSVLVLLSWGDNEPKQPHPVTSRAASSPEPTPAIAYRVTDRIEAHFARGLRNLGLDTNTRDL